MRLIPAALVLCLLAALPSPGSADARFRHLTTADNLSSARVWNILQDRSGYIWLATDNGLDRYDGFSFKVFKHSPDDPASLSADIVRALYEDSAGHLWVGTYGGGLDLYDPDSATFKHFRHENGDANTLSSNKIWSLASTQNHELLIGTFDAGMDIFNPETHYIRHLDSSDSSGLLNNQVNAVFTDRDGGVWLGTLSGLHELDVKRGLAHSYLYPGDSREDNDIWSISQDLKGDLVLATNHGVHYFDPRSHQFTDAQHVISLPYALSSTALRSTLISSTGTLFVGSAYDGLYALEPRSPSAIGFHQQASNPDSLSSNVIWDIYEDRGGLIWIATDNGVSILDSKMLNIEYVTPLSIDGAQPSASNKIAGTLESDHALLVGSTAGIYRIPLDATAARGRVDVFTHVETLRYGAVSTLFPHANGDILAGTSAGYLLDIDGHGKLRQAYNIGESLKIQVRTITRILPAGDGSFYLATFGTGLLNYDLRTRSARWMASDDKSGLLKSDLVEEMVPMSPSTLWIATFRGLFRLDPRTGQSTAITLKERGAQPVVESLYLDRNNTLWVGTYEGLWKLTVSADGTVTEKTDYANLPVLQNNTILCIEPDKQGNLWLTGNNILIRFNPTTEKLLVLGHDQGLPAMEYYSYVHVRTSNGWLWFGGAQGIVGFNPADIKPSLHAPNVAFNQVTIYRKNKPLNLLVHRDAPLVLDYKDAVISFDLAALDFAAPQANAYSYRLIGGSQPNWTTPTTAHQIVFSNLNPGDYRLEVKASNNWGVWSSQAAAVDIVVLPPWWRTWWAYTLYVMLIIGSITTYIHSLQRKIKREKEISASLREANDIKTHFMEKLESQVKAATHDLRETLQGVNLKNAELEIAQKRAAEGEQIKSQFLANMSHELRTPLTGVLGFTKLLAGTPLSSEQKDFIGTIRQSSESLLAIINDTLDLSRLEAGKLLVDEVDFDLLEVIESTLELLAPIAYQKRLELVRIIPPEVPLLLRGDPLRLRQILTNLLSNAIKFTESGSVSLQVQVKSQDERDAVLSIAVSDSGIGIPTNELPKLFHAYARSRISATRQVEGTGLGLAICKKLLDLMGGQIEVSSKLGGGSTFRFQLPFKLQKNQVLRRQLPGRPQILLYDTHPLSNQAWQASLRRMGADVRSTSDITQAASTQADAALIVLTDKDMVQLADLHAKLTRNIPPALVLAPRMDRPALTHISETLFHRVLSKAAREGAVLIELQSLVQTALPQADDIHRAAAPARTAPAADAPLILVTDDNRINRRLLVTMLQQAGMRAAEAASGLELIQLAQKGPWSAALVDIHMPGMDGIEAAERLYKLFGDTLPPVIAMSADVMPETRKQVLAGIICDFLMKPFNEQQLIETLHKHLDRHANRLKAAANLL